MRQLRLKALIRLQLAVVSLSVPLCLAAQSPPQPAPASESTNAAPDAKPAPITDTEQVTVTAYRAPLGVLESPVTTRLLTQQSLRSTAGITFDDQLRQLPGVELFRRSSSLVANPTSQGISLRALGSTSASRTLVTEDDVPLNDPLGGWIHWQEQPELSIKDVELVRGGASDLYGSSAIGGVVNILQAQPIVQRHHGTKYLRRRRHLRQQPAGHGSSWAVESSRRRRPHRHRRLHSGSLHRSAGPSMLPAMFTARTHWSLPAATTAISSSSCAELVSMSPATTGLHTRSTPRGSSATRRAPTGKMRTVPRSPSASTDRTSAIAKHSRAFRIFPTSATRRATYRCGEIPTKFSHVPDNELGAAAHWSQPFGAGLLLVVGADVHDVRVWDREQSYTGAEALTNLADHQRDSAAYAEAMWEHKSWTIVAGSRMDWFQNYDGHETQWNGSTWVPTAAQPPQPACVPRFAPKNSPGDPPHPSEKVFKIMASVSLAGMSSRRADATADTMQSYVRFAHTQG